MVGNQTHPGPMDTMLHLHLEQVLPDRVVFAVHLDLGFAAILTCAEQQPQMKAAQFFPRLRWQRCCRCCYHIPRIVPMNTCLPVFQEGQLRRISSGHATGFYARRSAGSGI